MTKMLAVILSASLALATAVPRPSHAHGLGEAQRLFQQGTAALQRGELAEARPLFIESLAQQPHPATAFNLAVTLQGLGMPVDSLEHLRALRDGRYGALAPERRAEVEQLARDALAQVATVIVGAIGPPSVELQIDGHGAGEVRAAEPREVALNPGTRVVMIAAPGWQTHIERVAVRAGERRRVEVTLVPAVAQETPAVEARPSSRAWWLWLGAAAVVGTATALLIARPFSRQTASDPIFGTTETLIVRW